MTARTLDQHIELSPGIAGGQPRVSGHPIAVQEIVVLHERMRQSADEIAAEHNLTLGDVHAALAYYFDHKDEMDRSIDETSGSMAIPSESGPERMMACFLGGFGSVLEFFPPPERFDTWRLGQDVAVNDWPLAVRGALADLQEDVAKPRGLE